MDKGQQQFLAKPYLDKTSLSRSRFFGCHALRDIQKTAARETTPMTTGGKSLKLMRSSL